MKQEKRHIAQWALLGLLLAALIFGVAAFGIITVGRPVAQAWLDPATASVQTVSASPVRIAAPASISVAQPQPPLPEGSDALVAAQEAVLGRIYENVLPSVVHIEITGSASSGDGTQGIPSNPQLFPGVPDGLVQGEGSGFVWDKDGHILTNNHVVENANEVIVVFPDGTEASAKVLGTDPNSDLAVIQVDVPAALLIPVQLGDSNEVKVGQMAVAIGNPFGLENTMTYGIISAVGRTISSGASQFSIPEVIQTDAPINPGNSGGPLLDRLGQVIGINTQIVSRSGSNSGIGFAVPINIAKRIVPALIDSEEYAYPWMGISGQTLRPQVAEAMDLDTDSRGALISAVSRNGPAAQAGLRGGSREVQVEGIAVPVGGDLITAIDKQSVEGMDDLIAYLIDNTSPGDSVTLTILRDGKELTVDITLGTRPSAQ